MEVFRVVYDNENDGDLYGISIVDDPANGFDFIAMSNKVQIKLASDQKKKILYGIVLRPEQKIYREFEDGTPFQLMFDAATIERFSQDFMKKGYQKNATFNHESDNWLSGTTVVENWIVMNKENDKGNEIGLPIETGDWCIGMKLSDELWSEYIETGKAKGFSIDSFISFEKVNMKNINMAIPPFHENCKCSIVDGKVTSENGVCDYCLEQINQQETSRENTKLENMSMLKKLIKLFSEGEVTLATLETLELGPLTADAFEVGNIVYDAELNPVLSTSFTADNKVYQTDETGTIIEVSDLAEETEEEEVVLEDVQPEIVDVVSNTTEAIASEVAKPIEEVDVEALKKQVSDLTAELEKLTKQQEAVLMENVELKNLQVSTKLKAEVKGQSPINMTSKEVSSDSALSAISRITQKNNK